MLLALFITVDFTNNFERYIQIKNYSVVFFSEESCIYCDLPGEIFDKVLHHFDDNFDILLGRASCDQDLTICKKQNINQVPTLQIYQNGILKTKFVGHWHEQIIIEWIKVNSNY